MKNILMIGASRSGKTTFSKMIINKYSNYQTICGDAIREAYKRTVNKDNRLTVDEVGQTDEYRKFIIEVFNLCIEYNKDLNYILDTINILPNDTSLINKENLIIIVFGYPEITAEEFLKKQRENDTIEDWTYKLSDNELLNNANYWIEKSKELEKCCQKLNIKFVDTSFNRKEVLKGTLQWLIEEGQN